jgi:hypothetical protein
MQNAGGTYIYIYMYILHFALRIHGVPGRKINILGGHSISHSKAVP